MRTWGGGGKCQPMGSVKDDSGPASWRSRGRRGSSFQQWVNLPCSCWNAVGEELLADDQARPGRRGPDPLQLQLLLRQLHSQSGSRHRAERQPPGTPSICVHMCAVVVGSFRRVLWVVHGASGTTGRCTLPKCLRCLCPLWGTDASSFTPPLILGENIFVQFYDVTSLVIHVKTPLGLIIRNTFESLFRGTSYWPTKHREQFLAERPPCGI